MCLLMCISRLRGAYYWSRSKQVLLYRFPWLPSDWFPSSSWFRRSEVLNLSWFVSVDRYNLRSPTFWLHIRWGELNILYEKYSNEVSHELFIFCQELKLTNSTSVSSAFKFFIAWSYCNACFGFKHPLSYLEMLWVSIARHLVSPFCFQTSCAYYYYAGDDYY